MSSTEVHWSDNYHILYKNLCILPNNLETASGQNALVRLSFLVALFLLLFKQTWGIFLVVIALIYTMKIKCPEMSPKDSEMSPNGLPEDSEEDSKEDYTSFASLPNFFKGTEEVYGDFIEERNNIRVNTNPDQPYYEYIYGKENNRFLYV